MVPACRRQDLARGGLRAPSPAIVWWVIAIRAADAFVLVAVAGVRFGSAYAWSEARKGP
jgi:hypothetical protein